MPLYEYRCVACEAGFTLLQSLHADPADTRCPSCGGAADKRMSGFSPSVAAAPAPGGCGNPTGGCGMCPM